MKTIQVIMFHKVKRNFTLQLPFTIKIPSLGGKTYYRVREGMGNEVIMDELIHYQITDETHFFEGWEYHTDKPFKDIVCLEGEIVEFEEYRHEFAKYLETKDGFVRILR